MSTPAFTDFKATSLESAAKPWLIISLAEAQSVTTTPSNPHSSRSTSFKMKAFPVEGTPSLSLNEVINVAAPALAAASNGGK